MTKPRESGHESNILLEQTRIVMLEIRDLIRRHSEPES